MILRNAMIVLLCALVVPSLLCAQATPGDEFAFEKVAPPAGSRWVEAFPGWPTARAWRFRHSDGLYIHVIAASVAAPESAMLLFHPKGTTPGEILLMDTGAQHNEKDPAKDDLKRYKGISFWLKGDGGDGELSLGTNWNQNPAYKYPLIGSFKLDSTKWTKHFVPFSKFSKDVSQGGFWYVNFKLNPATDRDCWAVVARLSFYSEETTEKIDPPAVDDPPGMIPASKFVLPSPEAAQKALPKTMAKLKAGQPLTIVAAGDSITAAAQLGYKAPEGKNNARVSYTWSYHAKLAERLARQYQYAQSRNIPIFWGNTEQKDEQGQPIAGFVVQADLTRAEDKSFSPYEGLQVIGLGAGGKDTRFGFEHLQEILELKPDLVIWAYGANNAPNAGYKIYTENTTRLVEALRQRGIEVILASPTPWINEPYYKNSREMARHTRELGKTLDVPVVDQLAAFDARGARYACDLWSDNVHPNEFGHQLMADTLATALGVPNLFAWDQPLFKARAQGKQIPKKGE